MRPHLKQRHELVDDLIKANIKVPEDMELESKEVEIMDFEIDLERDLSKIDHGIRDAYASVRELVGEVVSYPSPYTQRWRDYITNHQSCLFS